MAPATGRQQRVPPHFSTWCAAEATTTTWSMSTRVDQVQWSDGPPPPLGLCVAGYRVHDGVVDPDRLWPRTDPQPVLDHGRLQDPVTGRRVE
jgi:hypothetical protein